MKKIFISLLALCFSFCALSFTACEETVSPRTPETPPAETPPSEEETEGVEELERTVTTEFSLLMGTPCLLTTEYYGNQLQTETYYRTQSSLGYHFKYDYTEQGILKSFEWITFEHFYALSPDDPDSDNLFVELTQSENGKFTGTHNNVDVEIEVYENGTIKRRDLLFDNQYEDAYTVGAEFDEQGRRISDYQIEENNSWGIICQYTYDGSNLFSNTCSVTEISTIAETPIGPSGEGETQLIRRERTIECSIGRGKNNLLTNAYIGEEINVEFEYATNGRLISSATTYCSNGVITEKNTVNFFYYDTGFVFQVVEKEYGENNRLQYEYVYTYDEQGLRTGFQQITYDTNGNVITPEEPQTTVITEFSLLMDAPCLITTEYYGNQLQTETYMSVFDGCGYCYEYGYDEQGVLETLAWDEMSHFYVSKGEYSEHLLFALEQGENGKFTGATEENDVYVTIETYENGAIKKRALHFDNQYEGAYTVGAEFDEQGRRISDYLAYADNSYALICQYDYERDSVYSNSCTLTQIADGEEISVDIVTMRENNLLTGVYVEIEEVNFSFEYAQNGSLTQSATTYYNGEVITGKNNINYVYNEAGFVSQAVERTYNGNNQLHYECVHTYNEQGLKTHYEGTQYNSNGSVDYKSTFAYEYDSNGKMIKSTNKRYVYILDALVIMQSQIVEYNDTGRVSSNTDYNPDGSYCVKVEEYEKEKNTIHENLTKETKAYYDSNDTLYEAVVKEYITIPNGQNNWSRLQTKETTKNYNTDGSVKNVNIVEYEYNDKNKCTKITTTQYTANNAVEYKNVQEYTYDENGSEIKSKLTKYGVNCVLQSITEDEYVIHANARYTVKETCEKYNSNGVLSEIKIQTWDYHDNWQTEHHTIHEKSYLFDGNIDEEEITEIYYNDGQTDRLVKVIKTHIYYDYTEEYYFKRVWKREENSEQVCTWENTTDYRSDGSIIHTSTYDRYADGNTRIYTSISYDENGAKISETVINYEELFYKEITYCGANKIKSKTAVIDSNGNWLTCVEEYFTGEEMIDRKYEIEYAYTNTGKRLEAKKISTFYTAEGSVDYVNVQTSEYDDEGNYLSGTWTSYDADGNVIS